MQKVDLKSMTFAELQKFVEDLGEKKFRTTQLYQWMHQKMVKGFASMTNLSAAFRDKLEEQAALNGCTMVKRQISADGTNKFLMELSDGNKVESVLMKYHHGNSVCISTQVGCRMGCQFCASTIAGYVRDLQPSELLLQIYETQRDAGCRIDSIVLMGIGEPLDNFDNVVQFFRLLSHPDGMNMSLRHAALSTCGLVPQIRQLADLRLGVTLSVSLHSPENQRRSEIMPVNRRYPVEELLDACRYYFDTTGRRVTIEYAVINGVNNTRADAGKLAKRLHGMQCHVNLIPVNPVAERGTKRPDKGAVQRFAARLGALGLNATVRRELGSDIAAACGQMRRAEAGKAGDGTK